MGLQFKSLLLLFTISLWALSPLHAQPPSSTPSNTDAGKELPPCISDIKTLEKIEKVQKENAKSSRRYDGYREALRSSPDLELFTRLAYAETLAANCPSLNTEISKLIVGVIGQRIVKRRLHIQSVIFERSQFASSLHIYKNSRYRDFLCPKNAILWHQVSKNVTDFFAKKSTELPDNTFHYFLYKHDPRWRKEPWNLLEALIEQKKSSRNCIRVFRNPDWL